MAKRKLTTQQKRRVSGKRQKSSLEQNRARELDDKSLLGEEQTGLVITSFGKRVLVEGEDGEKHNCAIRQHLGKLVAGDRVIWQSDMEANSGVVVSVLPRSHELSRPGFRGQTRMVAANIDFIGVVTPVVPGIHPDMIDRYLVAAQQLDIPVVIIINKVDLLQSDDEWEAVAELLEPYDEMGIELVAASCVSQEGLNDLRAIMSNKNSVFVGPSGAGKSSLINALIPDLDIRTGELSDASGLGKHTTTNSILYHLPESTPGLDDGGNLIDSPGVRQFSPMPCSLAELESMYPDFAPFLGQCKFNNCTHTIEPQCAIKAAVENGDIAYSRYQSFQRLREEFKAQIQADSN
ncbi:MAG: small ribosomal subunit biogenesis GTPase RsgA [Thiomicrorhabdus chilensis]|uniref:small ribosomal subunit biogenesis GTPase RsgA n=1 Tax=Thiomicrorhabdus chilensis TaxID=63656 RepID=UPI00042745CC|nr:small ribosomal subunit biogenesis GTPase RsgA [Thiomicrorhabdus chilensis]MDX1346751.1 small ribosomal subunit biogenesis GTPase RsgA [Thiomicrorhabdus chilensis]